MESLTSVAVVSTGGQDYLGYTYVRRTDAPGVTYTVEVSGDLRSWTSDSQVEDLATVDNGNGTTTVSVRTTFTVDNGSSNYMRLRVARE